jgi:hypothetical protein
LESARYLGVFEILPSNATTTTADGLTVSYLPPAIYTNPQQVLDWLFDGFTRAILAYDPNAIVNRLGDTPDFTNSTLQANGQSLHFFRVSVGPLGSLPAQTSSSTSITIPLSAVDLSSAMTHVYLRTDAGPGHNLETPNLAGQADASPYTDMRHSDILGSVELMRGENPFTWRAFIRDERCFDVQHALQSLTLRLTDHRNVPLPDDVRFSCTLGVEVFIQHDIRQLGYGPALSRVDPKDEKILLSLR